MIPKNKIAYIRSLHDKTNRISDGVFLVEGRKCMLEFMNSDFEIVEGFFTEELVLQKQYKFPYQIVTIGELARMTTLTSNDAGILLVKMLDHRVSKIKKDELVLVLDKINDPGNLGTIIRTADWYGISQIICSPDTVDCYNTKVLMATMGSFIRVSIFYTDLDQYLSEIQGKIYGAYLNGESTHTKDFSARGGYLVIGSEAHGISANLKQYITDRVTIPRFGLAESLNAGVATAVILDRMMG